MLGVYVVLVVEVDVVVGFIVVDVVDVDVVEVVDVDVVVVVGEDMSTCHPLRVDVALGVQAVP